MIIVLCHSLAPDTFVVLKLITLNHKFTIFQIATGHEDYTALNVGIAAIVERADGLTGKFDVRSLVDADTRRRMG